MNDFWYGKLEELNKASREANSWEYTGRLQSDVRNRLGRKKCLRMDLSL